MKEGSISYSQCFTVLSSVFIKNSICFIKWIWTIPCNCMSASFMNLSGSVVYEDTIKLYSELILDIIDFSLYLIVRKDTAVV